MLVRKKLWLYRAARGYSQDDIAKVLGITRKTYSNKESGRKDFNQTEIEKLMSFFGATYEDLFAPNKYTNCKDDV